jgi:hypothetical protein
MGLGFKARLLTFYVGCYETPNIFIFLNGTDEKNHHKDEH